MEATRISTGRASGTFSHPESEMVAAIADRGFVTILWRDGTFDSIADDIGLMFDIRDRCPWVSCSV